MIHAPNDLDESAAQRADALADMYAAADVSPASMTVEAGFEVIESNDVTPQFRSTCQALVNARARFEAELRIADGDETYEIDQDKKLAVLTGIDEGLLLRSRVVAIKL